MTRVEGSVGSPPLSLLALTSDTHTSAGGAGDVSVTLGGLGYDAQLLDSQFREVMVADGYAPTDAFAIAAAARKAMGASLDKPLIQALTDA
jgi:hypothetical protein